MKAYKLILELIKHPFSNVKLIMDYDLTHVRYSKYWGYLLESINNKCESVHIAKNSEVHHYQEDADGNFAFGNEVFLYEGFSKKDVISWIRTRKVFKWDRNDHEMLNKLYNFFNDINASNGYTSHISKDDLGNYKSWIISFKERL